MTDTTLIETSAFTAINIPMLKRLHIVHISAYKSDYNGSQNVLYVLELLTFCNGSIPKNWFKRFPKKLV